MSENNSLDTILVSYGADKLNDESVSQTEHFSSTLSAAKEALNKVPSEGEYEYYTIFPEFCQVAENIALKAVDTIQKILNKFDPLSTLNLTDNNNLVDDYEFAPIETLLDTLLEKTDKYLDISKGLRNDDNNKEGILQSNFKNEVKNPVVVKYDNTIEKPQLHFKDGVDNTPTPFVPKITEKPNAMVPLKIEEIGTSSILTDNAPNSIFNTKSFSVSLYRHPYDYEISNFKFSDWMLEEEDPIKFGSLESTPLIYVDTLELLMIMIENCKDQKYIALDLEHHSLRSYQGFTCLIQLSTLSTDYLIDCIKIREYIYLLNEITTKPTILKILHGADMDIQWLQKDFGVYVVNMFDSGQASRTLSFPSFGLAYLLKTFCNVTANKEYQLADWRIRPMDDQMKHYAREDTHYLIYLYITLKSLLLKNKQDTFNPLLQVYKASNMLTLQTYEKPHFTDNDLNILITKKGYNLSVTQKELFKAIYRWRDSYAREMDESPSFLMSNIAIYKLSVSPPSTIYALKLLLNPLPYLLISKANELIRLIKNTQTAEDESETINVEGAFSSNDILPSYPVTDEQSNESINHFFDTINNNKYIQLIQETPKDCTCSFSVSNTIPQLPVELLTQTESPDTAHSNSYITYLRGTIDAKRRLEAENIYKKLNLEQLMKDMTELGLPSEDDTVDFTDAELLSLSTPSISIPTEVIANETLLTRQVPHSLSDIYNINIKDRQKAKKNSESIEEIEDNEEIESTDNVVTDQDTDLHNKKELEYLTKVGIDMNKLREYEPQAFDYLTKEKDTNVDPQLETFIPIKGVDYNSEAVKSMVNSNMPQMNKNKKGGNRNNKNNNFKKNRGNNATNKSISYKH